MEIEGENGNGGMGFKGEMGIKGENGIQKGKWD